MSVTPGIYRNKLGSELVVTHSAGHSHRVLSDDIWLAESRGELFGTWTYMVTEHSLKDAGYELKEPTP